ncbi:MAG: hypothetical protein AAFQ95_05010 [Cyanobacteria bacterium J06621_3]
MKVLVLGLAIAATAIGGGVGYSSLKTGQPIGAPLLNRSERPIANRDSSKDDSVTVLNGETLNGETEPFENEKSRARNGDRPTSQSSSESPASEAASRGSTASRAPEPVAVEPGDIVITEDELNQLVTDAIAAQPRTAPILDIAKDINTTLDDGRIESSMVVNINELPLEELPPEAQAAVDQMTTTFPFLANRDVYLGIEGSPTVTDEGNISLTDAHIKFGQLKLPVSNVAGQIGISQADIEQQLNAVLAQQGLTPESIEIVDEQIVIRGL